MQFTSVGTKRKFLDLTQSHLTGKFKDAVIRDVGGLGGSIFMRKPFRFIIPAVRCSVKANVVKRYLDAVVQNIDKISEFKEGKLNGTSGTRSIMFSLMGQGLSSL